MTLRRYVVSPFRAVGASLGLVYARMNRFVVDPFKDTTSRKSGPSTNDVVLFDAGLQLILTGRKTWRGFAPYVGGVLGVAIGGTSPRDTSGYKFGTKFTVAPNVGLRWYPARRLSVRGDVRLVLWKLNYPTQFKQPDMIDNTPVLPLKIGLISTVLACGLGIPVGFVLATRPFWGRRAALTVVNTALAFPTVV